MGEGPLRFRQAPQPPPHGAVPSGDHLASVEQTQQVAPASTGLASDAQSGQSWQRSLQTYPTSTYGVSQQSPTGHQFHSANMGVAGQQPCTLQHHQQQWQQLQQQQQQQQLQQQQYTTLLNQSFPHSA